MADLGSFDGALIFKNNKYTVNQVDFQDEITSSLIDGKESLPPCLTQEYNHKVLNFENIESFQGFDKFTSIFIHDKDDNLIQVNSGLFSMSTGSTFDLYFKENINKVTLLSYDFNWSSVLQADITSSDTSITVLPEATDQNGARLLNGNKSFILNSSYIKIGSEIMRVTSDIDVINGIITVERGQKGTTAVAHLTGASVIKEYSNAVAIASINLNTVTDLNGNII